MGKDVADTKSKEIGGSFKLNFGTYEQAKKWIGKSTKIAFGDVPVNKSMIQYYCTSIQDGNLSYWNDDFAKEYWGGCIAPPGMLQTWTIPFQWRPDGAKAISTMAFEVPLPGDKLINVSTEFEFLSPVREGDFINMQDTLAELSELKTTKIGRGYFITTVAEYRNQRGCCLARNTNILFRYEALKDG